MSSLTKALIGRLAWGEPVIMHVNAEIEGRIDHYRPGVLRTLTRPFRMAAIFCLSWPRAVLMNVHTRGQIVGH